MFVCNINSGWEEENGNNMDIDNQNSRISGDFEDDCISESPSTSFHSERRSAPIRHHQNTSDREVSYFEISNGCNNMHVSFQHTPSSTNSHYVCETWPMPLTTISMDNYSNGDLSINLQSSRRGWREHMRRMSTTFHKSSALRLRGVFKGPTTRANKNRTHIGLDEAMVFSLSDSQRSTNVANPYAAAHDHTISSSNRATRSPRWMSAARRVLDRVLPRGIGHRKPARDLGFSYRNLSCSDVLATIGEEEAEDDHEEEEQQVSSAMDELNRLNVVQNMGTFRVKRKQRPERRLRKQLSATSFGLGKAQAAAKPNSLPVTPDNPDFSSVLQGNIEEELCERLSDLPMTETDPDALQELHNSMQSLQFSHFKQD